MGMCGSGQKMNGPLSDFMKNGVLTLSLGLPEHLYKLNS